jgi:hypothetical protein
MLKRAPPPVKALKVCRAEMTPQAPADSQKTPFAAAAAALKTGGPRQTPASCGKLGGYGTNNPPTNTHGSTQAIGIRSQG